METVNSTNLPGWGQHILTYGYDSLNRVTSVHDSLQALTTNFVYDGIDDVTSETTSALNNTVAYGYDADGRRTSLSASGGGHAGGPGSSSTGYSSFQGNSTASSSNSANTPKLGGGTPGANVNGSPNSSSEAIGACSSPQGAAIAAGKVAASISLGYLQGYKYGTDIGITLALTTGNLELIPAAQGMGVIIGMGAGAYLSGRQGAENLCTPW